MSFFFSRLQGENHGLHLYNPGYAKPARLFPRIEIQRSTIQVIPYDALQFHRRLASHLGQVLDVITGSNTKTSNEVFGLALQIATTSICAVIFILRPAKVGVGAD